MYIVIKEKSGFMPDTIIKIYEDKVELEENNKNRVLKYNPMESREIIKAFLKISKNWEKKYVGKGIIDEDIFVIDVVDKETKQYYIKNKYPQNWSSFILFRNKLVREEIKFN